MFSVNVVLHDYVSKKSGTSQVLIDIWYNQRHFRAPVNLKIRPDQFEGCEVNENHPEHKHLNKIIAAKKSKYEIALLVAEQNGTLNMDFVEKLSGVNQKKKHTSDPNDFYEFCKNRIEILKSTLSPQTIEVYESKINSIKKYAPRLSFGDITPEWIAGYVAYMKNEKENKNNTVWERENFLNSLLEAAIPKYIASNPMSKVSRTKYIGNIPFYLTQEKQTSLENIIASLGPGSLKSAGMYFLIDCEIGLRVADLASLNPDKDIIADRFIKRTSKGKTIVSLKISERLKIYLSYLKEHPFEMSIAKYRRNLIKLSDLLGWKQHLHPHVARHTLGFRLAQAKVNIRVAQKILGHKSIASTEIYYHLIDENIDEAIDMISK